MPLILKRLTETAKIPTRATEWAAGLDLYADETVTIHEYHRAWVSTGIAIALDPYHGESHRAIADCAGGASYDG